MLKFKRKLLAAILAASIVLSSGVVWSEGAEETTAPEAASPEETETGGNGGSDGSEEEEAPVTEEEALAAMKEIAKNDKYTLYLNEETLVYAIKTNASGYIWWSTPYDYQSDPVANKLMKNMMASTISYQPLDVENNTLVSLNTYSYESCVARNNYKLETIDNGFKVTYNFTNHNFSIPVYVKLEDDHLAVGIPIDEMVETSEHLFEDDKDYKIITLNLAQAFGAARGADEESGITADNGYIFVPDGSGAVINFNNGKTSTQPYSSKVYGTDLAVSKAKAPNKTEQTYFPVLGMVKEVDGRNEGMLAIVTEGDAYATVNTTVSRQAATNYNSAWFSFDLRATDTYTMGTKTPLTVFQSGGIRVDGIEVSYYFMSGDDLGVADLAETYRNYLINEKGLTKQDTDESNALSITTVGGTITKKSVLGFPVDTQTVATSYENAQEILSKLKDLGVDKIQLIYNDFTDSAVKGKVTTGASYSGKLGGKDGFTALYDYIKNNGGTLYPGVNFMEYTGSGNGYSFTLNSSKRVTNAYATQTDFELAFGNPDTDVRPTWTILSPYYWPDVFRKITESFTSEGINSITLQQATESLYSDFSRYNDEGKAHFVRSDSIKILTDGYQKLNDAGISILAQECNAYALPYVKSISNVPLYSSNYDLFDYDVPFYQMVIHGYIPYSSKPVNASSDANELRLLSMMTGSGIGYMFMYHSPNEFIDTKYDKYFYANYEGWLEIAAKDYEMYNKLVGSLNDETIVKYTHETAYVYSVEYSDGTVIKVDVDNETISVNGQETSLADYELKGDNN